MEMGGDPAANPASENEGRRHGKPSGIQKQKRVQARPAQEEHGVRSMQGRERELLTGRLAGDGRRNVACEERVKKGKGERREGG